MGGVRKFEFRISKPFVSILFVRSGRRGRKFKSCHLDHNNSRLSVLLKRFSCIFSNYYQILNFTEIN